MRTVICLFFFAGLYNVAVAQGLPQESRDAIHTLFESPEKITRSVDILKNGYVATTTSKDAEVVKVLQLHVDQMNERLSGGRPVRRWDPAFSEFFDHYDDMEHRFTKLDNGIRAEISAKTPEAVKAAHNHAQVVMGFSARGDSEMHARHAAATEDGARQGRGFRGGPPDSRDGEVSELFSKAAGAAAEDLKKALGGQLKASLESGGPVAALSVCQSVAIPLTKGTSGKHEGIEISRVALKTRNKANGGDAVDKRVLRHFVKAAATEEGEVPAFHLTTAADGVTERFYQPLMVAEVCLKCHGDPKTFGPELKAALAQFYPKDKATGYTKGDFRGLIKVEKKVTK